MNIEGPVSESLRCRALPPPAGTLSQLSATWPCHRVDPPEVNDMEVDEQRREAAPETRRRATRPAQGSAMAIDGPSLLPESDAVHLWTPRDRVTLERMITNLAREAARLR